MQQQQAVQALGKETDATLPTSHEAVLTCQHDYMLPCPLALLTSHSGATRKV